MSGAALASIVVLPVLALIAWYAEAAAGALSRFWSRYPLVRLAGDSQRLRPSLVRGGAVVLMAAMCAVWFLLR